MAGRKGLEPPYIALTVQPLTYLAYLPTLKPLPKTPVTRTPSLWNLGVFFVQLSVQLAAVYPVKVVLVPRMRTSKPAFGGMRIRESLVVKSVSHNASTWCERRESNPHFHLIESQAACRYSIRSQMVGHVRIELTPTD